MGWPGLGRARRRAACAGSPRGPAPGPRANTDRNVAACLRSRRGDPERAVVPARLILLCGLAGAGKTTLAKQLEAEGAMRMCPDEWLEALGFDIYDKDARVVVEGLRWALSQALLLRGLTVVD